MRIVALNAIHVPFYHRMMLRHSKFGLRLKMALKTRARILSRIDDELPSPSAHLDMFAPRPMAGFATRLSGELCVFDMHTRMRARRKYPRDIRMTLRTSVVPNISCTRNFRRRNYRAR
jgi:hypothetical protein